jgi:DNA-binding NarL/FixJ family response regulator
VRVVIADDHDFFRVGLRRLLELEGIRVVADVPDGASCVREAVASRPDVVLLDLYMPGMSGVETTRELRRAVPDSHVLVLTVSAVSGDAIDALMAGACGYLLKDAAVEEILLGVRAAARGESPLSPTMAAQLIDRIVADRPAGAAQIDPPPEVLTAREREILRLVAEGRENAEIGRVLHLSPSTVKTHVSAILAKLGVENRLQAAVYAVRAGIA